MSFAVFCNFLPLLRSNFGADLSVQERWTTSDMQHIFLGDVPWIVTDSPGACIAALVTLDSAKIQDFVCVVIDPCLNGILHYNLVYFASITHIYFAV